MASLLAAAAGAAADTIALRRFNENQLICSLEAKKKGKKLNLEAAAYFHGRLCLSFPGST